MSHVNVKNAYKSLEERINKFPQGAPPSKTLYSILSILFTEKEAELVAQLPIKPFRVKTAAKIWSMSYSEALKITDSNIEYLEEAANSVLRLNNAGYTARCSMEKFYFDTTEYSGFTLPRGEYTALTIRLGKAEGKNWWCVVYPTLCLSSAAEYDNSDDTVFISTDKFNIKFRTVEIWQDIKHLFTTSSPLYTHIE